jgi:hypothetical protein
VQRRCDTSSTYISALLLPLQRNYTASDARGVLSLRIGTLREKRLITKRKGTPVCSCWAWLEALSNTHASPVRVTKRQGHSEVTCPCDKGKGLMFVNCCVLLGIIFATSLQNPLCPSLGDVLYTLCLG